MPKPRFSAGRFVIAMSSKLIAPESGCSRPAIILRVVVLPQPEGPSRPKNSPRSTSSDTSVTAGVLSKRFQRFLRVRSGIIETQPHQGSVTQPERGKLGEKGNG